MWEGGGIVEGQGSYGCVAVETWEVEEDRRREGGGAACGFSGIVVGRGQFLLFRMRGHGNVFHDTICCVCIFIFLGGASRWDGYRVRR